MCSPPPECGPAAVANVPLTTSASPAPTKTSASRRSSGGTTGGRPPVAEAERLHRHHDCCAARSANERSRCVITTGQRRSRRDGEVADRRLGERAEEDEQRDPPGPVRKPWRSARGQPRDERERDHDAADEPVSELDEGVDVLLGQRPAALAAGPGAAAEARVGQPDGGAAADDQPEEERVRERELDEPRGRELEARGCARVPSRPPRYGL